jgi:hypothetical protein
MVVWVQSVTPITLVSMPSGWVVVSINLSGTALSSLGAQNQGAIISPITVTTAPPGFGTHTPITVTAGSSLFAVDNGGILPCNLIAAVDIPAGSYSVSLSAT